MRSNYLQAIESKAAESVRLKTGRRTKQRASFSHTTTAGRISPPPKSMKPGRQSWHPSNTTVVTKAGKRKSKSTPVVPKNNSFGPKSSPTKSRAKSNSSLHRADSLTLGALVPPASSYAKKVDSESSRTLPSPMPSQDPSKIPSQPPDSPSLDHAQRMRHSETEPALSGSDVPPEIEAYDIFYQDLCPPSANPTSISSVPDSMPLPRDQPEEPNDAAPPPPDITWTPRKRTTIAM